jgi:GntR family transcriptional repressor for pyruvate dehydrogenase complex
MAAEQATRASGQPREPLSVRIHRDLSERIARGEFAAGAQLPTEKELSESYGVSRAVVREAITILRADGLVLVRQGAGVFSLGVRPVPYTGRHPDFSSVTDAIETLELRLAIECEAAALAATRRTVEQLKTCHEAMVGMDAAIARGESATDWDMRFHRSVAAMAHNSKFQMLFEIFGETLIPRTRFITTKGDPDAMRQYLSRVNREHEAVFIAIERQDPDTARAAMRMHLVNVKEGLRIAYETENVEAEERG